MKEEEKLISQQLPQGSSYPGEAHRTVEIGREKSRALDNSITELEDEDTNTLQHAEGKTGRKINTRGRLQRQNR